MSGIILGKTQYGKAENRVVRIYRDSPRHEIRDINVSTCLRGDFSAAHLTGVKEFAGFLTDPYTVLEPPTIA